MQHMSLVFILSTSLPMVLLSGAFLSFFDLGAWGILIALTPSLFQTNIRGTAMGTAQSIGRFGATIGPFLVGWLLDMKTGIAFIFSLFVALLLIAVIIINFGISEQPSQ